MKTTSTGIPAAPAGGVLYLRTDLNPEQIFQAIGDLNGSMSRVANRLEILMGSTAAHGGIKKCMQALVTDLIDVLDEWGDDPDLEPVGDELDASFPEGPARLLGSPNEDDEDGADDEPSLGSSGHGASGAISYLVHPLSDGFQMIYDCEGDEHDGREEDYEGDDNPDAEPSLGWTVDGYISNTGLDRFDVEMTSGEGVL